MNNQNVKLKQTKNLFNALTMNCNCICYGADRIIRNSLNKVRKSFYIKGKVLTNLHNELEKKYVIY